MASGPARRGHTRGLSTSATGWRFPLRTELRSPTRPADHHIVHTGAQDEIERLNGYLRTEVRISSGIVAPAGQLGTRSLLDGAATLGLALGSWSMSALPGDPGDARGPRKDGRKQVRPRDIPYFLSPAGGADPSGGPCGGGDSNSGSNAGGSIAISSPPLTRQPSAERCHSSAVAGDGGDCAADLLAAQSPPLDMVDSPPLPLPPSSVVVGGRHCSATYLETPVATPAGEPAARIESLPQRARSANTHSIIALYSDAEEGRGRRHRCAQQTTTTATAAARRPRTASGSAARRSSGRSDPDAGAVRSSACGGPISASDAEFLDAVSALLPETPKTGSNAESSPRSSTCTCPGVPGPAAPADAGAPERCWLERVLADKEEEEEEEQRRFERVLAEEEQLGRVLAQEESRRLERALAEERRRHGEELERQRAAMQARHSGELAAVRAERDQLRALLDECVAVSEELARQGEAERDGLARELGCLTLERQRLEEQLGESQARAKQLAGEQQTAQARMDAAASEHTRLEGLCATLRGDVAIAEQRNLRIMEHAQDTLAKANAEIARLQTQAELARASAAEMEARATKAEARAKSLHIQLASTKQQNKDLLALCEGL
ncbi:hypothetical protein H4R18_003849 [Coemansia javaensis]|uniref:Uncharacterized protein n=1 Tax=Coemansia javaensis TaxID=2761396 RepID=A0A9W8LFP5_9FUNG|nr:hypothetical protein H4R18_003849 [Coemansia javaensis]